HVVDGRLRRVRRERRDHVRLEPLELVRDDVLRVQGGFGQLLQHVYQQRVLAGSHCPADPSGADADTDDIAVLVEGLTCVLEDLFNTPERGGLDPGFPLRGFFLPGDLLSHTVSSCRCCGGASRLRHWACLSCHCLPSHVLSMIRSAPSSEARRTIGRECKETG